MHDFKLSIGPFVFKPGLPSSLTSVLLIPLFIYLGFWQLERMHFKNELQEQKENQMKAAPLKIEDISNIPSIDNIAALRFKPLEVTGYFLNHYSIILDNQIYQGRVGYRIIIPFQIHNLSTHPSPLLLIDRGWVPLETHRTQLPDIMPIFGKITLTGILNDPPKPLSLKLLKGIEPLSLQFPILIQNINFQKLSTQLQAPIFPMLLTLHTRSPYAFEIFPITFGIPSIKHLAYAIQWFLMAFVIFIYYCILNTKKQDLVMTQPISRG